jgi:hypothetical protein
LNCAATEYDVGGRNAPRHGLLAVCGPRRDASAIIGRIDQQRAEPIASPLAPGAVVIVGPSLIVETAAEIAPALRVRA